MDLLSFGSDPYVEKRVNCVFVYFILVHGWFTDDGNVVLFGLLVLESVFPCLFCVMCMVFCICCLFWILDCFLVCLRSLYLSVSGVLSLGILGVSFRCFVRVWLREVCLLCLDLVLGLGKKDLSSLFYALGSSLLFIVPRFWQRQGLLHIKKGVGWAVCH